MDKIDFNRLHELYFFLNGFVEGKSQKAAIGMIHINTLSNAIMQMKSDKEEIQALTDKIAELTNSN